MFTDMTRSIFKGAYKHASLFKYFALQSNIIYASFDIIKLVCLYISSFSSDVLCLSCFYKLDMFLALLVKLRLFEKT
jgi:hypothetical protein